MPHVVLSQKARQDLRRLYSFLAGRDPIAARNGIGTVLNSFDQLVMPTIGSPVLERKGLRKLVIPYGNSGYTALYRYSKATDTIVVIAIKHQRELDYK